jgi:hypothetical protein
MDNKLKLSDYILVTEHDLISFLIVTTISHIASVVHLPVRVLALLCLSKR